MGDFNELRSLVFERPSIPLPEIPPDEATIEEPSLLLGGSETQNIWARSNHRFKLLVEGIDYLSNQ